MDLIQKIDGSADILEDRLEALGVSKDEILINRRIWHTAADVLEVERDHATKLLNSSKTTYSDARAIERKYYDTAATTYLTKNKFPRIKTIEEHVAFEAQIRQDMEANLEYQREIMDFNRRSRAEVDRYADKMGTPITFMAITGCTPESFSQISGAVTKNGEVTTSEEHTIYRTIIGKYLWTPENLPEIWEMGREDGAVFVAKNTGLIVATNGQVDDTNPQWSGLSLDQINETIGVGSGNTGTRATARASSLFGPSYRYGASEILRGFYQGNVFISTNSKEDDRARRKLNLPV